MSPGQEATTSTSNMVQEEQIKFSYNAPLSQIIPAAEKAVTAKSDGTFFRAFSSDEAQLNRQNPNYNQVKNVIETSNLKFSDDQQGELIKIQDALYRYIYSEKLDYFMAKLLASEQFIQLQEKLAKYNQQFRLDLNNFAQIKVDEAQNLYIECKIIINLVEGQKIKSIGTLTTRIDIPKEIKSLEELNSKSILSAEFEFPSQEDNLNINKSENIFSQLALIFESILPIKEYDFYDFKLVPKETRKHQPLLINFGKDDGYLPLPEAWSWGGDTKLAKENTRDGISDFSHDMHRAGKNGICVNNLNFQIQGNDVKNERCINFLNLSKTQLSSIDKHYSQTQTSPTTSDFFAAHTLLQGENKSIPYYFNSSTILDNAKGKTESKTQNITNIQLIKAKAANVECFLTSRNDEVIYTTFESDFQITFTPSNRINIKNQKLDAPFYLHEGKELAMTITGQIITSFKAQNGGRFETKNISVSNTLLAEIVNRNYKALTVEHYHFALAQEELQKLLVSSEITDEQKQSYKNFLDQLVKTWEKLRRNGKSINNYYKQMAIFIMEIVNQKQVDIQPALLTLLIWNEKVRLEEAHPKDVKNEHSITSKKIARLNEMLDQLDKGTEVDIQGLKNDESNKIFFKLSDDPGTLRLSNFFSYVFWWVKTNVLNIITPTSVEFIKEFTKKAQALKPKSDSKPEPQPVDTGHKPPRGSVESLRKITGQIRDTPEIDTIVFKAMTTLTSKIENTQSNDANPKPEINAKTKNTGSDGIFRPPQYGISTDS